jgi:hypothetical protein
MTKVGFAYYIFDRKNCIHRVAEVCWSTQSVQPEATRCPVDVIQMCETVGVRRSRELPTKFRTRAIQSRFRGPFTRLGEGPLEPGDDCPVFMMPLAGVVRNDLEDVPRELETAFQTPHVQSRLAKGQRSECERHLFMWFGPNGLTLSTDLPGTILDGVRAARRLGAPVTVKQQAGGHDPRRLHRRPAHLHRQVHTVAHPRR